MPGCGNLNSVTSIEMTRFARWRKTYNTSIREDSRDEPYNASYGNFSKLVSFVFSSGPLGPIFIEMPQVPVAGSFCEELSFWR